MERKNDLLALIQGQFEKLPDTFRFFVTSRPETMVEEQLSRFKPEILRASNADNQKDVSRTLDRNEGFIALLRVRPRN